MNTCGTCRHWVKGWKYYGDRPLSPLVVTDNYGVCKMVDFAGTLNEVFGSPATIYFGIGDDLQLVTKSDFGCNQWEAKEANNENV